MHDLYNQVTYFVNSFVGAIKKIDRYADDLLVVS